MQLVELKDKTDRRFDVAQKRRGLAGLLEWFEEAGSDDEGMDYYIKDGFVAYWSGEEITITVSHDKTRVTVSTEHGATDVTPENISGIEVYKLERVY